MTDLLLLTQSQLTLVQVSNLGTELFFVCIPIPIIWEACINNTTEKKIRYKVLTWPLSQDVTHLTGSWCVCVRALSHVQLCNPVDCNSPGSYVHGIFQARILEQVAVPYPRGPSQLRNQTCTACISCIGRWILHHWTTREALLYAYPSLLSEKHI